MISTQYINLNMVPSGVMPVLHCSQYDVGRPLGVVIYNGSESVDLSGYTVTIEGTRTDRTPVTAGVTTDGNIGVFTTTPTMTNENDTYRAKVVLTDNAGRVSSLAFVMCVDEKTMDENAEEIEEDASLYQQYTGTVQTIIAQIRGDLAAEITARQNAVSAEATARQTAVSAEASARQAADNTLQSNINAEASARATEDASLQSQINQLIAPSGSAPSAAEVENARIGSDGTVYPTLGDAIRTQNSLLKNALDDISVLVKGVNRLNTEAMTPDTVPGADGALISNADSSTSDFIACEPGDVVRYYRLSSSDTFITNSSIVYLAEYTSNRTFIKRTAWAKDYTVSDNCYFIRVALYNTNLSSDKISAITLNDTLTASTIAPYNDYYILADQEQVNVNTDTLNAILSDLQTVNRFNMNTITKNKVIGSDGTLTDNSDAFTSDFIPCLPGSVIRYYRLLQTGSVQSNSMLYLAQYGKDKAFIARAVYANGAGNTTLDSNCYYVRISNPLTQLSDQVIAVTFDTLVTRATLAPEWGGSGVANLKNLPAKLKVMTYNIGRYSYGLSPYYIDTDYEEKVANYKRFFARERCDVLGIEENNIYLDAVSNGNVPTNTLYSYLYPWFADEGNGVSLKSKYPMYDQGMGSFTASGRTYVYGTINVNGKEVYMMTVHLTPNSGETEDALRAQEIAEILSIVSNKDYFIVFGDFNAQTTALYDSFTSLGYHIANGGYLPFEWTYSYEPADYSADTPSELIRYFDNIVTSGNITIDYSERLNVYDDLSSDHIPFIAYLTVT